jgi:hypothetical protein
MTGGEQRARTGLVDEASAEGPTTTPRAVSLGARLDGPGMVDGGLAAAVDALARAAFNAGLAPSQAPVFDYRRIMRMPDQGS